MAVSHGTHIRRQCRSVSLQAGLITVAIQEVIGLTGGVRAAGKALGILQHPTDVWLQHALSASWNARNVVVAVVRPQRATSPCNLWGSASRRKDRVLGALSEISKTPVAIANATRQLSQAVLHGEATSLIPPRTPEAALGAVSPFLQQSLISRPDPCFAERIFKTLVRVLPRAVQAIRQERAQERLRSLSSFTGLAMHAMCLLGRPFRALQIASILEVACAKEGVSTARLSLDSLHIACPALAACIKLQLPRRAQAIVARIAAHRDSPDVLFERALLLPSPRGIHFDLPQTPKEAITSVQKAVRYLYLKLMRHGVIGKPPRSGARVAEVAAGLVHAPLLLFYAAEFFARQRTPAAEAASFLRMLMRNVVAGVYPCAEVGSHRGDIGVGPTRRMAECLQDLARLLLGAGGASHPGDAALAEAAMSAVAWAVPHDGAVADARGLPSSVDLLLRCQEFPEEAATSLERWLAPHAGGSVHVVGVSALLRYPSCIASLSREGAAVVITSSALAGLRRAHAGVGVSAPLQHAAQRTVAGVAQDIASWQSATVRVLTSWEEARLAGSRSGDAAVAQGLRECGVQAVVALTGSVRAAVLGEGVGLRQPCSSVAREWDVWGDPQVPVRLVQPSPEMWGGDQPTVLPQGVLEEPSARVDVFRQLAPEARADIMLRWRDSFPHSQFTAFAVAYYRRQRGSSREVPAVFGSAVRPPYFLLWPHASA